MLIKLLFLASLSCAFSIDDMFSIAIYNSGMQRSIVTSNSVMNIFYVLFFIALDEEQNTWTRWR